MSKILDYSLISIYHPLWIGSRIQTSNSHGNLGFGYAIYHFILSMTYCHYKTFNLALIESHVSSDGDDIFGKKICMYVFIIIIIIITIIIIIIIIIIKADIWSIMSKI